MLKNSYELNNNSKCLLNYYFSDTLNKKGNVKSTEIVLVDQFKKINNVLRRYEL